MDNLVYLLPVLGCVAMMAVMVWLMRGNRTPAQPGGEADGGREEIAALRAEVAALRAQQGETARRPATEPPSR